MKNKTNYRKQIAKITFFEGNYPIDIDFVDRLYDCVIDKLKLEKLEEEANGKPIKITGHLELETYEDAPAKIEYDNHIHDVIVKGTVGLVGEVKITVGDKVYNKRLWTRFIPRPFWQYGVTDV